MPNFIDPSRVVLALVLVGTAACGREEWEGILYPKTGHAPFEVVIGKFESLQACRQSAQELLAHVIPEEGAAADYECGRDCEVSAASAPAIPGFVQLRVCEETSR